MKIIKINENQIRCILTKDDLDERQLKLSELAYGTPKARGLFRDLMQQAAIECDFRADNMPLMIEAIPTGNSSIVLVVTKVDNPEELDTRFSSFSPAVQNRAAGEPGRDENMADITHIPRAPSPFEQLLKSLRKEEEEKNQTQTSAAGAGRNFASSHAEGTRIPVTGGTSQKKTNDFKEQMYRTRLFIFPGLAGLISCARICAHKFEGESVLFLDDMTDEYHLLMKVESRDEAEKMGQIYAFLTEYGRPEPFSVAREEYLYEHCRVIIESEALQRLSML